MAWVGAVTTEVLADDERYARRHHLSLSAQALAGGNAARVEIHNLSETGLLIEVDLALEVGDEFDVELPEVGATRAEVVWRSDGFYGCEFSSLVSTATVSAARLRSLPPERSPVSTADWIAPDTESTHRIDPDPHALTPRQRLLVVGGLALACWVPILLVVWAIS